MRADELAAALGGTIEGDPSLEILRACHPDTATGSNDLAVAILPQFFKSLAHTKAAAALVPAGAPDIPIASKTILRVPASRNTLPEVSLKFASRAKVGIGAHPTAFVDDNANLSKSARIGPMCTISGTATIADDVTLIANVTIGENVTLGAGTMVHPGARVGPNVRIGENCVIQSNAVIGSDGFSFLPVDPGNVEAVKSTGIVSQDPKRDSTLMKIESLGGVVIEADVEIGANTSIDSGTFLPTRIGRGTKIDNQVQIGHNVQIGEDCLLCGQVGLAGSVRIGDRTTLGGRAAVADNLQIGSDVVIVASAAVASHVPANEVYMGMPAIPRARALRDLQNIRRLDRLIKKVFTR